MMIAARSSGARASQSFVAIGCHLNLPPLLSRSRPLPPGGAAEARLSVTTIGGRSATSSPKRFRSGVIGTSHRRLGESVLRKAGRRNPKARVRREANQRPSARYEQMHGFHHDSAVRVPPPYRRFRNLLHH